MYKVVRLVKVIKDNDGNNIATIQVDLRKKSSLKEEINYKNIDVQSCMVVLVVIAALLLSVISVVAAQNP